MHPIPCSHCGNNFMRPTNDPEAPRLCNNCALRESVRIPSKKNEGEKEEVTILIHFPRQIQNEIEEHCIAHGLSFSEYFLRLYFDNLNNQILLRGIFPSANLHAENSEVENKIEDDMDVSTMKKKKKNKEAKK